MKMLLTWMYLIFNHNTNRNLFSNLNQMNPIMKGGMQETNPRLWCHRIASPRDLCVKDVTLLGIEKKLTESNADVKYIYSETYLAKEISAYKNIFCRRQELPRYGLYPSPTPPHLYSSQPTKNLNSGLSWNTSGDLKVHKHSRYPG